MKRTPIVLANWKLNGSVQDLHAWLERIQREDAQQHTHIDKVLLPNFVLLPLVMQWMQDKRIDERVLRWGSQNIADQHKGPYSGEVSAEQLIACGCQYALVGHSERRMHYGESNQQIGARFACALEKGLVPIACLGETKEQHKNSETHTVLKQQLTALIQSAPDVRGAQTVIAYEPVWAIGSGSAATAEQAQEVHAYIRTLWSELGGQQVDALRVVYGGSVRAENAAEFGAVNDIDGLLVGGASLDAEEFLSICDEFGSVRLI